MTTATEPRTAAGRTMMDEHTSASPHMVGHVCAVEDESWNTALREVEYAVVRLDNEQYHSGRVGTRAALAAVASLRRPVTP